MLRLLNRRLLIEFLCCSFGKVLNRVFDLNIRWYASSPDLFNNVGF
jgi:hypothetical protein